jgi:hypothetical protein
MKYSNNFNIYRFYKDNLSLSFLSLQFNGTTIILLDEILPNVYRYILCKEIKKKPAEKYDFCLASSDIFSTS